MRKRIISRLSVSLAMVALLAISASALDGNAIPFGKEGFSKFLGQKKELTSAISLYPTLHRPEALETFRRLIKESNPVAAYYYADYLAENFKDPTDSTSALYKHFFPYLIYRRVFPVIASFAEQGDAVSQNVLGEMYNGGRGVKPDYRMAAKWTGLAADQGNAEALYNLAQCYETGIGVKADTKEAIGLYIKAAKKGNADAQYRLGGYYSERNPPYHSNYSTSLKWYTKAVMQWHTGACRLDHLNCLEGWRECKAFEGAEARYLKLQTDCPISKPESQENSSEDVFLKWWFVTATRDLPGELGKTYYNGFNGMGEKWDGVSPVFCDDEGHRMVKMFKILAIQTLDTTDFLPNDNRGCKVNDVPELVYVDTSSKGKEMVNAESVIVEAKTSSDLWGNVESECFSGNKDALEKFKVDWKLWTNPNLNDMDRTTAGKRLLAGV